MHPNEKLVRSFYEAFARKDWRAMEAAYHPDVHFTDEVFDLHGKSAGRMWRMLCEKGADLEVVMTRAKADDRRGSAHWDATYTFSVTGRKVLNRIDATFEFQDGKIVRHIDRFSFWKWARQALGPVGAILGWTPLVRTKVKKTALGNLEQFSKNIGDTAPA
jgi:ketosteroid isomerase-like protein